MLLKVSVELVLSAKGNIQKYRIISSLKLGILYLISYNFFLLFYTYSLNIATIMRKFNLVILILVKWIFQIKKKYHKK